MGRSVDDSDSGRPLLRDRVSVSLVLSAGRNGRVVGKEMEKETETDLTDRFNQFSSEQPGEPGGTVLARFKLFHGREDTRCFAEIS